MASWARRWIGAGEDAREGGGRATAEHDGHGGDRRADLDPEPGGEPGGAAAGAPGRHRRTGPAAELGESACYDVGHLYSLAHFRDRGLVSGPLFIQFVLGILGGIGADPDNLIHMKRIADKLFGDSYQFSVLAAGRQQMPLISIAAAIGGNVRVGLEDSLYDGRQLAKSNADQVRRIRGILDGLSLEVATPAEAREMLALKGGDRVAF